MSTRHYSEFMASDVKRIRSCAFYGDKGRVQNFTQKLSILLMDINVLNALSKSFDN